MTAAAPTPPPHLTPISSINGSTYPYSKGPPGAQPRNYAHIKDLNVFAQRRLPPQECSIDQLLTQATNALATARKEVNFKRLDYAFVEYIIAQELLVHTIRTNKDFPQLKTHRSWEARYDQCLQNLRNASADIDYLTKQIREDNTITGVSPKLAVDAQQPSTAEHRQRFVAERVSGFEQRPQGTFQANGANPPIRSAGPNGFASGSEHDRQYGLSAALNGHTGATSDAGPNMDQRWQAMQRSPQSNGTDALEARFSTMRFSEGPSAPQSNHELQTPSNAISRPHINLHSRVSKDLPKVPSPTYSPAKAMPDEMDFRTSQRSRNSIIASSDTASLASTISMSYQSSHGRDAETTRFDRPESAASSYLPSRSAPSRAENRPKETEISAQRLYDHMDQYRVLLIDVRPREQFDAGHIFGHVVSIEPAALRPNKSAQELEEALVVSPETEYELFTKRNDFDLVVYYDQSTKTTDFLNPRAGGDSPLRNLHDSLCFYNDDKPLKWQPILLIGGLDAWVDLAGPHSLHFSTTAAQRTQAAKAGRPIARRPPASGSSRLNVSRRTLRDYNPLGPEEERKWRERARSESVVVELSQQEPGSDQDAAPVAIRSQPSGTYDSFQQRYPDVASVESQVMQSRPPSRPPPSTPQVPSYPATPSPSVPMRPQPALPRPSYSGVSERSTSQSYNNPRSSDHKPYIPPKLLILPRTGLHNFGVTCYMNATVQCLSATLPLTLFFLQHRWQKDLQEENWKGSKGIMPGMYNTLLTNIWRPGEAETIRPSNFRKFCARLNREWGLDRQQDAKEFFDFLVDTLHEDLNVNWRRNPLRGLTEKEEAHRERAPPFLASKGEFDRYIHRDWSKLTELFAGQHISRLQCTTCTKTSTTYETFYSISVEIPPNRGRPVSLHDCLRSYTTSETLAGDEVWRCPNCRAEREATKRITISRAPEYLVIHFKRFSASHTERARKVHTPIDFPLKGLDMSSYMLQPPDAQTVKYLEGTYGPRATETPPSMQPPFLYDAYAVMRHLGGTMGSGHYIALVEDKSRGRWRQFNDDKIDDFMPEQLSPSQRLQNEQAYIVFYQRVR